MYSDLLYLLLYSLHNTKTIYFYSLIVYAVNMVFWREHMERCNWLHYHTRQLKRRGLITSLWISRKELL